MEFGIFIQNYLPEFVRQGVPDAEHKSIMDELKIAIAADKAGFKYLWASEHHFLDEYSHLSANDVVLSYLAAVTERIHLGSGIFNPLPQVNHPAKVAERVAYLDHVSNRRFEFGTGRGAGSHEILGFLPGITDMNETKAIWAEVIGEFPKMWLQDEYEGFNGKYWSLPPRKVLPKPYGPGHPAMWYAAGNPASYEQAARMGLGVLGFGVGSVTDLEAVVGSYKKVIVNAEPVGAFVNDNIMITSAGFVAEDENVAKESLLDARLNYMRSQVFRYHDTFPHPPQFPHWPELIPDLTMEDINAMANSVGSLIGTPDRVLGQCKRWEASGADQLVLSVGAARLEDTLETIRLMGEHVIPKIDTDPVHRTTRFREAATGTP
jgi:alkanesulfonate monooxygenase SsuD/methylene tetrahydromethanopterin reductase-like flavin-dependent oxidoreductase (luciferase family)